MVSTDTHSFSFEELQKYNGEEGRPVYVSVQRTVYDMSSGATFYGPGGPYHIFAGHECSRALAKMKIDESELNDNIEDCSEKERQTLQDWVRKFVSKYPIVGVLRD
ncbi:cytochrome b5-like heme/steroid binding domain-containing protein [Dunaliella salina]|uniref:Cytochrome b5-like heme/steroid binding domain-containing protein n=1 Tax=Dunaliella salina TaxID=3046 RepID=A0ABQ7G331_DUNSA|nr:cytochrome b5-like heme/steroid binding domain-containing protein [Dunaliella salina]|eukprot:KAF5829004.1 cytochrome b5-like heme/steroid binding domain-containing protein [Dunaliella salina]